MRRFLPLPPLVFFASAVLAAQIIAAVISIAANWPSQFDGVGTDAGEEFVGRGTALAPPLIPMILFTVSALLALRRDRWGLVGVVGVCLLAVLFVIGSVGEALADETPDVAKGILVTSGVAGTIYGVVLLVLGFAELRERSRHEWRRPAEDGA